VFLDLGDDAALFGQWRQGEFEIADLFEIHTGPITFVEVRCKRNERAGVQNVLQKLLVN